MNAAVGSEGPRGSIEPLLACKELFNQLAEIRKNAQCVEIDLQHMTREVKHIAYQHQQHYHPPRNPVESTISSRDFRVSQTESMNQFSPPPPRGARSPTSSTSLPPQTPLPNARATSYDNKPSLFERFYQGLEQQKISPITSPTLQPPQEPLSEYTSPSYRTNYPRSSRNQHFVDSPFIEVIDVEDDQINQQQQQKMELSEEIESIHPRRSQHQSEWDFLSVSRSMPYPLPPCVTGQVPVLDNKYVPCVVDDAAKPFVVIRVAAPATSFSRCICMLLTANGPAEQLLGYRPEDLPVRADHLMALDKMSLLFNYPGIEYLEALNDPTSQAEGVSPVLSVVFRMHHRDGKMLEMVIRHQLFFNEGAPSFIICVFDGMRLISPETNAVETIPPQYPPSIHHSPFFPINTTTSTPTQYMQMM